MTTWMRFALGLGVLSAGLAGAAARSADDEPKIAFDAPTADVPKNPGSPAKGVLAASGKYSLAKGATFAQLTVEYRIDGEATWTAVAATVDEKKQTWEKKVEKLVAGTYQVRVSVRMKSAAGEMAVYTPNEPTERRVLVAVD